MASQKTRSLSRAVHPILNTLCCLTRKISPSSWSGAPVRAQSFSSSYVYPPAMSWSRPAHHMLGTDRFNSHTLLRFHSAYPSHAVTLKPQVDRRGLANRSSFGCPPDTPTTVATPNKPVIYVAPVTEDNYDKLVEWTHTVMSGGDPVFDYVFPYPERASEDTPQTPRALMYPSCRTFKAVLTGSEGESDRMVGYVHVGVQGENWIEEEIAESARKGKR